MASGDELTPDEVDVLPDGAAEGEVFCYLDKRRGVAVSQWRVFTGQGWLPLYPVRGYFDLHVREPLPKRSWFARREYRDVYRVALLSDFCRGRVVDFYSAAEASKFIAAVADSTRGLPRVELPDDQLRLVFGIYF